MKPRDRAGDTHGLAAVAVVSVLSIVVIVYALTGAYLSIRTGTIAESSKDISLTALGALTSILVRLNYGTQDVNVTNPPKDPVQTESVK